MNWELYKNKLKNKMSPYQSEVDIDELWGAIEPNIEASAKKKKRKYFFWFFLAGIALVGLGWFLGSESTNKNQSVLPTEIAEKQKEETQSESNEKERYELSNNSEDKSIATLPSNALIAEKKTEIAILKNSQNAKKQERNNGNKLFQEKEELLINRKDVITVNKENIEIEKPNDISLSYPDHYPIHYLSTAPIDLIKSNTNHLLELLYEPVVINSTQIRTTKSNDFSLSGQLLGGLSSVNRKMAVKSRFINVDDWLQLRKDTEKTLEAIHYGTGLTIKHRSGFEFSTGLQKTIITERLDYSTTTVDIDTIESPVVCLKIDTTTGNGTYTSNGLFQRTTTSRSIKNYNKHRLLDIPILLGYSHKLGQFNVGVQGGAFVNVSLKSKGKVLVPNSEFINNYTNAWFKDKAGLSYYFGLTLSRPIFSNWAIGISSFIRYFPKEFNAASSTFSQKYRLLGGHLSLSYQIGH